MQEPEGSFSSSVGWTLPGFQIGKKITPDRRETTGNPPVKIDESRTFVSSKNCIVFVRLKRFDVGTHLKGVNVLLWAHTPSERVQVFQSAAEGPRRVPDWTHPKELQLRAGADLLENSQSWKEQRCTVLFQTPRGTFCHVVIA